MLVNITRNQLLALKEVFGKATVINMAYVCSNTLYIFHTYGFFSGCSVLLYDICEYYNSNLRLPDAIDSSNVFSLYQPASMEDTDIRSEFFDTSNTINISYTVPFEFDVNDQFKKYSTFNFKALEPFLMKYFNPSHKITDIYTDLLEKYTIDLDNCIGLYYRGTDKAIETSLDSFDIYYMKLNEVLALDSNDSQILVQTDSAEFLEYMKDKLKNNKRVIIIKETSTSYTKKGIHNEKTPNENYLEIQSVFATFLILSKCKHLICSSGNTSMWMVLFRGHGKNIYQNLHRSWI